MALAAIRRDPEMEVVGLFSTMNADADRVAMHAVRRSLVEAQADRLGLPLTVVEIPDGCTNEVYESQMAQAIDAALSVGIRHFVFGDLYLEDVRAYRERQLQGTGITPLFPLWGTRTDLLAQSVIQSGVEAVITCVDPGQMPSTFVGRLFDSALLDELPVGIDPCGEKGEFHTFVFNGPGFSSRIEVRLGEVVERDGFVFCDVLPT